ncbi:hypothetical protein WA577_006183 [Blastocystis sp. JDR]
MEAATEVSSLETLFAQCQKEYNRLSTEYFKPTDPTGGELIESLEKHAKECELQIRREHVFSINETIKDISTDDIKYLMVGYYLSFVLQKGMKDRLQRLERATSYIESFLDVLRRCEILEKDDEKQYEYYLEMAEKQTKPDMSKARDEKIRRYRVDKECEKRLAEIKMMEEKKEKGGIVDEDLEREKWILALQSCARKCLNDLDSIPQELEILRYMEKMKEAGKDPRQEVARGYEAASQKPMQVLKIGRDLSVTRESIKADVFKPWWNLPTRSMDDYAEQEMRHMREVEAAQAAAPKPDMRMKELEEKGLEDDMELVDKATT